MGGVSKEEAFCNKASVSELAETFASSIGCLPIEIGVKRKNSFSYFYLKNLLKLNTILQRLISVRIEF